MSLQQRTERLHWEVCDIAHVDHGVRITHRDSGHGKGLTPDLDDGVHGRITRKPGRNVGSLEDRSPHGDLDSSRLLVNHLEIESEHSSTCLDLDPRLAKVMP